MKSTKCKLPGDEELWDTRELGADPNFAKLLVTETDSDAIIDAALELQPISIRLQKSLIEDFKLIAQVNGLGYQPLMRQVLTRFADSEKKRILREFAANIAAERCQTQACNNEPKTGTDG